MSVHFWVNLIFAVIIFVSALVFINRTKIKAVRYFLADRLRRKTIPKLKAILPLLPAAFTTDNIDPFPLFRLRADLESICSKADVLFDVERLLLEDFLAELSRVMAQFKAGRGTNEQIENLILVGQRAVNELSEFKR